MVMYTPKIERVSKYTKSDLMDAREKGISDSVFHQRLHKGWTVSQAKSTPVRERKPYTEIELEIMERNNLTRKQVNSRIKNGVPREVAISMPQGETWNKTKREQYEKEKLRKQKKIEEERNRKELKKQELLKIKKPYLFTVPQKTEFGDYAQQLFEDCCGSWSK
ncbi:SA1788 family PVL leukocidin-associated protein [Mammaliicoccus fleurettii]|uniref:SA1788 family PVL leukocidin-associated protein n=1 Tax=Mammaliicoccus fleurettii TaxID=150056 RepID=UPI002DBD40F1|nr:SA1788 family PVL leukocidin-associated protein [Mammaliicoccus fleurettii]MEB7723418.1 hypothetical protein [Mammaliicoccus fleurettii]